MKLVKSMGCCHTWKIDISDDKFRFPDAAAIENMSLKIHIHHACVKNSLVGVSARLGLGQGSFCNATCLPAPDLTCRDLRGTDRSSCTLRALVDTSNVMLGRKMEKEGVVGLG